MGKTFNDRYSILHFFIGIISWFLNISFSDLFILHGTFEFVENTPAGIRFINRNFIFWPGGKPYPDAHINMLGDQVFALLGWLAMELAFPKNKNKIK